MADSSATPDAEHATPQAQEDVQPLATGAGAGGMSWTVMAGVAVAVLVVVGSVVGVAVSYPSALAQTHSYVRQAEMHGMSRLPSFVRPLAYEVHLHPHLESGVIEGQERIQIVVDRPTSRLLLHVQGINITGLNLHVGSEMLAGSLHVEHERHVAYLTFTTTIPPGKHVLELSFRSHMHTAEAMSGAYVSTIPSRFGNGQKYLATYLHPVGARSVFPCFDEPSFPANFTLSLATPHGYVALSNARAVDATRLLAGGQKVHFTTTSPISPHDVTITIAPLHSIETTTAHNTLIRVWARDGAQVGSRLALRLAVDALDVICSNGTIARESEGDTVAQWRVGGGAVGRIEKLDLVALPDYVEDSRSSPGICVFRESHLLFDLTNSPSRDRVRIAMAVWRCVAMQWFGFIPAQSPQEWSEKWLGAGLSNAFSVSMLGTSTSLAIVGGPRLSGISNIQDMHMYRVTEVMQPALEADVSPFTHPLVEDAHDQRFMYRIDDQITRAKATAVVLMIQNVVGAESRTAFRSGLLSYLEAAHDSHVTPDDFWKHLEDASKVGVQSIVSDWLKQPHFPLLDVSFSNAQIAFKQSPFVDEPVDEMLWHIPLTYFTNSNANSDTNETISNGVETTTLFAPAAQTRFECAFCIPDTRTPTPTPTPTPTLASVQLLGNSTLSNASLANLPLFEISTNSSSFVNASDITLFVTSLLHPNNTNNSTRTNSQQQNAANATTANEGGNATDPTVLISKVLEQARAQIESLQAQNIEAQRHISELETRLHNNTTPTPTPTTNSSSSSSPTPSPTPSQTTIPSVSPSPSASYSASPSVSPPPALPTSMFASHFFTKLNWQASNLLRVNYPQFVWDAFGNVLRTDPNALTPVDRANILDDAFALGFGGKKPISLGLQLCTYLANETHPLPWTTALKHLKQLSSLGFEETWVEQLGSFVLSFLEPAVFSLNLLPAPQGKTLPPLAPLLLDAAVDFRSVSVTAELTTVFPGGLPSVATSVSHANIAQFLKQTTPDLRQSVLAALCATGAPGTFETVLAVFHHSQLPSDRINALRALATSKNHHERIRLLNIVFETRELTTEEILCVLEAMCHSHEGRSTVWRKFKDNWPQIRSRFTHGAIDLDRIVTVVASSFISDTQHEDIKEFFEAHPHRGAERAIHSALNTIKRNTKWIATNSPQIEKFLQQVQISNENTDLKETDNTAQPDGNDAGDDEKDQDLLQLPLKITSPTQ